MVVSYVQGNVLKGRYFLVQKILIFCPVTLQSMKRTHQNQKLEDLIARITFFLSIERNSLPAFGWSQNCDYGLQIWYSVLIKDSVKSVFASEKEG